MIPQSPLSDTKGILKLGYNNVQQVKYLSLHHAIDCTVQVKEYKFALS